MSESASDVDTVVEAASMATAILVFAHHIGIDINLEKNLMYIASESIIEMPDGWELGVADGDEENAGIPYFFNSTTEESVWEHPNEKAIMEKVVSERLRLQNERKVRVIARKASVQGAIKTSQSQSQSQSNTEDVNILRN